AGGGLNRMTRGGDGKGMEAVSVVGLGKLGACLAVALARRGKRVIGYDVDAEVVRAVREGRPPVDESGLPEALAESAGRLTATHSIDDAIRGTDVTFVVVPTPSEESGAFSLDLVRPA